METFLDLLGWTGTVTYLAAFALNSAKRVESDSITYQGMNIFAGSVMAYYTFTEGAYPAAALNVIWAAIGMVTLVNKWRKRQVDPDKIQ